MPNRIALITGIISLNGKAGKSSKVLVSGYDHKAERWRWRMGYTDAALSRALGRQLEPESADRREGFSTSTRDEANAPIEGQLKQFLTHCRSKWRTDFHVGQLESHPAVIP